MELGQLPNPYIEYKGYVFDNYPILKVYKPLCKRIKRF